MMLCISGVSVIPMLYGSYLPYSNNGHRDATVPLTEARIEMIHKYMDAAAELGRNPVSKHQIQLEYGDEQADAGRDCRNRLTRPNSQARTRTGEY